MANDCLIKCRRSIIGGFNIVAGLFGPGWQALLAIPVVSAGWSSLLAVLVGSHGSFTILVFQLRDFENAKIGAFVPAALQPVIQPQNGCHEEIQCIGEVQRMYPELADYTGGYLKERRHPTEEF